METLSVNTEVTLGNTESIAQVTKATELLILCVGTKRATKPVTPRETTLDIPISTISVTPDPSYTPRYMKNFTSHIYWFSRIFYVGVIK